MKTTYTLLAATALMLAACGEAEQTAEMDHSGHDMTAAASGDKAAAGKPKGGLDYKKMFGPDYKRGDVGHSFGTVMSVAPGADYITLDHGKIHGIGMGAMTMGFDVLKEADVSGLEKGTKVEFLVKKGLDGTYRVFAICDMGGSDSSCLEGTLG